MSFDDDNDKANRDGARDGADGKDYSEPLPRPFESDEHYQARKDSYRGGYFNAAGQKDGTEGRWIRSTSTSKFGQSFDEWQQNDRQYRAGYENATGQTTDNEVSDAEPNSPGTSSGHGGGGGGTLAWTRASGISPNVLDFSKPTNLFALLFALVCAYLWIGGMLFHNTHAFDIIGRSVSRLWSPTNDVVLNFFIDCILLLIAAAFGIGSFAVGVVLLLVLLPLWILSWIAQLGIGGAIVSGGIVLFFLYKVASKFMK